MLAGPKTGFGSGHPGLSTLPGLKKFPFWKFLQAPLFIGVREAYFHLRFLNGTNLS